MNREFSFAELADAAAWAAQIEENQIRDPHWQKRRQHMAIDIERHKLMARMLRAIEEDYRAAHTRAAAREIAS